MHDNSIDSPAALLLKLHGKNAIYHERVTLLIEILGVRERNGFFKFEAIPAFRSSSLVDWWFLSFSAQSFLGRFSAETKTHNRLREATTPIGARGAIGKCSGASIN